MAEKLAEVSLSSIIKSLGEDIEPERFTCGGSLEAPLKVQLNYLNNTGVWCGATFPGIHDADLQQILKSSVTASFGRGEENVIDKNYRDAYALEPEKFTTSFQLSSTLILGEIRQFLVPDVPNIYGELYKMNIYTGPTGCFKAHVDTPRGGNMFGSLVVCLPSRFAGGELVIRHRDKCVTYNWSTPADNPAQNIQWATFFSDVEHEVLQVTEGHRITLTYNLYHCDLDLVPAVDITTSSFYSNLKAAIKHPHFLRKGGVLGFFCQHAYVFEEFNKRKRKMKSNLLNILPGYMKFGVVSSLPCLLKGSDRVVLFTAKSLGLEVDVRPILNPNGSDSCVGGDEFEFDDTFIGEGDTWEDYYQDQGFRKASYITWCNKCSHRQHRQPAVAAIAYGNDYSLDVHYQTAAILVTVPPWSERHCDAVAESSSEGPNVTTRKRKRGDEDGDERGDGSAQTTSK